MLDAYRLNRTGAAAGLNPDFSYLRVQVDEREVFLALGYVEQHPDGPVEVWFSANAEVLRLYDGRVVGAVTKTGPGWLSVSFKNLPSWDKLGNEAVFDRARDLSPGYRYGIREKMLIRRIAPPDNSQLKLVQASSLTWFEERVQGDEHEPPARYAVSLDGITPRVVYAEQCLSGDLCFSWQRWTSLDKGAP
ncbi:MAG: hypothetical protein A2061_11155 [Gallionellales bacterium GWA2_59_43]|nr:MAG: hypothetical protein A2061_11155 [Gallionellales bacterium GWA2_59_43]